MFGQVKKEINLDTEESLTQSIKNHGFNEHSTKVKTK